MSSVIFSSLVIDMAKAKKTEQVGFKVDSRLFAELEAAADLETRPRNTLARLVFEWAFARYKEVGSYDALVKRKPFVTSVSLDEGTSEVGLNSHISNASEHVNKERLLDDRTQMGADIHGASKAGKKSNRSKAS